MMHKTRALFVHLFTATGAVFAMLAMLAAVDGKWDIMLVWLVIAFLTARFVWNRGIRSYTAVGG